jgi:hypothetical protein
MKSDTSCIEDDGSCDELAAFHSIASSASAISLSGVGQAPSRF